MLFNSIEFLFVFLPLTLALMAAAYRGWGKDAGILAVAAASLIFYG